MTFIEKKRIKEVDILRGLAAVFMVLGHSFIQYPLDISGTPWCVALGHFIYTFHMELFFVLAGFVYHCTFYARFMKKKVKRLLVPYLFFGAATMLLHAYGGAAINGIVPLGEGIRGLLFYGGGYWFIYTSFLLFAIFPLLERVCAGVTAQIVAGILCVALQQFVEVPSVFAIGSIVHYLPYFIAGHCAAALIKWGGGTHRFSGKDIWVTCVSMGVYCLLDVIEVQGTELRAFGRYIRAMSIILAFSIGAHILCGYWREHSIAKWLRGLLTDCSRFSLQIYLFNGYLMTVFRIVLCQVLGVTSPLLIVLVIWTGNIFASLLLCKKIIPRIPVIKELCGID